MLNVAAASVGIHQQHCPHHSTPEGQVSQCDNKIASNPRLQVPEAVGLVGLVGSVGSMREL